MKLYYLNFSLFPQSLLQGKVVRSDTNLKFDSKATKIQFSFAPRRIQGPIKFR